MDNKKDNLAEKLNRLFEEKRKPDGSQYSQTEVIEGTNGVLTRVYLWKLRTGRASNPGLHIVQAIAAFFGVDPNYFFGESNQLASTGALHETQPFVDQIALRAGELDEAGRKAVLNMIDYILTQKGNKKKK